MGLPAARNLAKGLARRDFGLKARGGIAAWAIEALGLGQGKTGKSAFLPKKREFWGFCPGVAAFLRHEKKNVIYLKPKATKKRYIP
jgi:hypothetical protein